MEVKCLNASRNESRSIQFGNNIIEMFKLLLTRKCCQTEAKYITFGNIEQNPHRCRKEQKQTQTDKLW